MGTLRFGIMTDSGFRFARWQADAIRELLKIPGVEPILLIQNAQPISLRPLDRIKRIQWRLLLGQVYVNLFCQPPATTEMVDLTSELRNVKILRCEPELKGKCSAYFRESDRARIRDFRPDFLLRFGFNIIRGGILRIPRYGICSSTQAPIYRRPTNLQTFALLFKLAQNQARYFWERLFVQTTWGSRDLGPTDRSSLEPRETRSVPKRSLPPISWKSPRP